MRFTIAALALVLGSSTLSAQHEGHTAPSGSATPAAAPTKDIVTVAVEAGSFTTLAKALQAAGLVETLQGTGPFTVFAPTDAAFAKLPAGTVEALLNDIPRLRAVLTYHVVDGKVRINDATVVSADVQASNGVIHVIDTVILPKD